MPTDPETSCTSCDRESAVHTHCRPGTDCGLRDCARFRGSLRLGALLRSVVEGSEGTGGSSGDVRRPGVAAVRAGRSQPAA